MLSGASVWIQVLHNANLIQFKLNKHMVKVKLYCKRMENCHENIKVQGFANADVLRGTAFGVAVHALDLGALLQETTEASEVKVQVWLKYDT